MCKECCVSAYFDRGTTCLDSGTYFVNFKKCNECGKKQLLGITERKEDEEDGTEEVTYNHVCNVCGHIVAQHYHRFEIDEGMEEVDGSVPKHCSLMECALCGRGSKEERIIPMTRKEIAEMAGMDWTEEDEKRRDSIKYSLDLSSMSKSLTCLMIDDEDDGMNEETKEEEWED